MNSTQKVIKSLGPWFHNIHLPDGTQTAPDHFLGDFPTFKWEVIKEYLPIEMTGWTVLDIGCNAGFYSIQTAMRGARVDAVEADIRYLKQAQWAAQQFGLKKRIRFRHIQVYDIALLKQKYDLVLFMGVFYHLRYPTLALDIVAECVSRLMIFQTLTMPPEQSFRPKKDYPFKKRHVLTRPSWPKMAFIEHYFAGDPTNWWIPNHSCVEALLRSSGMKIVDAPGHEIYVCKPDPKNPSAQISRWSSEYTTVPSTLFKHAERFKKKMF